MRPNEFVDKDVFALEEKICKIKGMEIDPVRALTVIRREYSNRSIASR